MIPHEGQGNPVVAFNGQKDCSLSNVWLALFNPKIKGIASVRNAPVIPRTLFRVKFFICTIC